MGKRSETSKWVEEVQTSHYKLNSFQGLKCSLGNTVNNIAVSFYVDK